MEPTSEKPVWKIALFIYLVWFGSLCWYFWSPSYSETLFTALVFSILIPGFPIFVFCSLLILILLPIKVYLYSTMPSPKASTKGGQDSSTENKSE